MSLTLESVRGIFLETQAPSAIPDILTRFQELNLEDQLALLWYAYRDGPFDYPCGPWCSADGIGGGIAD